MGHCCVTVTFFKKWPLRFLPVLPKEHLLVIRFSLFEDHSSFYKVHGDILSTSQGNFIDVTLTIISFFLGLYRPKRALPYLSFWLVIFYDSKCLVDGLGSYLTLLLILSSQLWVILVSQWYSPKNMFVNLNQIWS